MNSAEKQAVLHCLKSMIDEEVCEECPLYGTTGTDHCEKDCVRLAINALSNAENPNKWIPITSRPMTEEEKEHYKTHPEYQDDCRIFNCKLPDDGQEVLISVYGGVEVDTFVQDANDGCYFEGRDIDDVDAWMPLPEPYKQEIPTGQIVANGELYPGEFDDPLAAEGSEE